LLTDDAERGICIELSTSGDCNRLIAIADDMQKSAGGGGQSLIAAEGLSHRKRTPSRGTMTTTEKGMEGARQTLPLGSWRGGSMRVVMSGDGGEWRWGV
jgi:hypothetical protein